MKKTILLIHGWNYRNYTSQTDEKDAWHNRMALVKKLEEKYNIYRLNLPGFCGQEEPKNTWDLDDYAKYIRKYIEDNKLSVDYILGYSFGGAIAIRYKTKYKGNEKLILVSPAIIRTQNKSKKFVKTPKLFEKLRNLIRDFYLINIVKTNEMVYGTKFLRSTYQVIARVDLKDEVKEIPKNDFIVIYGEEDEQVNPSNVISYLGDEYKNNIKLISGGKHNIGVTNVVGVVNIIDDYVS